MASNRPSSLKKRKDFLNLSKRGRKLAVAPWVLFVYTANEMGVLRCGVTIPRGVGNAVKRNRLRRWCRVFFQQKARKCSFREGRGLDLNVVFRARESPKSNELRHSLFLEQMEEGWEILQKRFFKRSEKSFESVP